MARPKCKPHELTPRQRLFIEHYYKCKNATQAARLAGLKCPDVAGSRMLTNVKIKAALEELNADLRSLFVREAMSSFKTLMWLKDNATMEMVRLKASQDILDRAGYKPIEKSENLNINSPLQSAVDYNDPVAMQQRLEELRSRAQVQVKQEDQNTSDSKAN